jgi:hypothetical protein
MKEEGLLHDAQSGGFFHIYSDGGKLIIDRQPCQHEHSMPTIVIAQ